MKHVAVTLLIILLFGQSGYAGLAAHWRLEDGTGSTTAAESIAGNNGTLTSMDAALAWVSTGLAKVTGGGTTYALNFDGIDDRIVVTGYKGISGTAARSVAFWIKAGVQPAANNQGPTIISWGGGAVNGQRFDVKLEHAAGELGKLRCEVQGGYVRGTKVITDGNWHHVVVSLEAGKNVTDVVFYIDGILDPASVSSSRVIDTANIQDVQIANSYHSAGRFFQGILDDVRIYNHALSQKEAWILANGRYAWNPDPKDGGKDVPVDKIMTWSIGTDPNNPGVPAPNITGHFVYLGTDEAAVKTAARTDTTGIYRGFKAINSESYQPSTSAWPIQTDKTYYWRVDERLTNDDTVATGAVWKFETIKSFPVITKQPQFATVFPGQTAVFTVEASSITTLNYQWYMGQPGDTSKPVGTNSATLTLTNVQVADEGYYYCRLTNDAGPKDSDAAQLLVKRLVGHWKLDGDLNDQVAGRTGIGTDPNFVAGFDGQALDIMADNRIVEIPDSNDFFNFYPRQITVSAWLKTTQSGNGTLVSKQDKTAGNIGFLLTHNSSQPIFNIRQQTVQPLAAGTAAAIVADGQWHMITGTYDNTAGIGKLYVDGILNTQTTGQTILAGTNPSPLIFGAETKALLDSQYKGQLDDVRIWNYAVEPLDIARIFTQMSGRSICYEYPVYDFDRDCRVGISDFALFAATWMKCNIVPDCIQ